ncbi:hypothetical protein SMD20_06480 [Nonomuraea sp. LP-02]|uniref:hypothetical protein n=1 Tax=Nonomuraea sp. LP-02 TaxID=3097960 RepID=UPI002E369CBC|nr:hypothetical protein [Nonomuraea sp. LP-02]MED7923868.1 hypothetical protein [Nonomuraea sp. LP-02]
MAVAVCVLLPVLGAGTASAARTGDDPVRARVPDGKPPAGDVTGPREPVPGGFAGWAELFAEQARLNAAADRVLDSAENAEGYAGMIVAPENHEVRVYWHGEVPPDVRSALEEGRLRAPVRVLPAAYSQARLLAEAAEWTESGQVTGAAPAPDGSGVRLSVAAEDVTPGALLRPSGASAPITVEGGEEMSPAWDRRDDVPSYYAGGRTRNAASGAGCTSGFAVYDKNGSPGFLTAAHCGKLWDTFYDGGGTGDPANRMGQYSWYVTKRDAAIVLADATANAFNGSPSSASNAQVVALWKAHVGNFVCNSGASLGQVCLIRVTEVGWSGTYTNGQQVKHMVRAKHVSGGCAVAAGDSGGPIFSYPGAAWWQVAAQGIVSAWGKQVYCGGLDGGRVLTFPRVWDVDKEFGALLQVW